MIFDTLLGNDRLKQNLAESLAKGHISHFYLISGPRGCGKRTLAKLMAQAILCRGSQKPCGTCDACRKIANNNHPDVLTVEDPDHKNVAVKIVRQFREDVFILPNESDYKIYIFPQDLGVEGQNALLKILEEPPKYGVFLLLTVNPEKILPTVRSRCTELKLLPLPQNTLNTYLCARFPDAGPEEIDAAAARSGGFLGQALELLESGGSLPPQTADFARAIGSRDPLRLAQPLIPKEKWKRDAFSDNLQSWLELTEEALAERSGRPALSPQARILGGSRTPAELYQISQCLKQALDYTGANVSPAAICGWLIWQLR